MAPSGVDARRVEARPRVAFRSRALASLLAAAMLVVSGLVVTSAEGAPIQTLVVDSRNPSGTNSVSLAAGVAYLFTASGTFFYGLNGAQADPECSNLPPDPTYQRNRFAALGINEDPLDLYVNGGAAEWVSTSQDPLGCNRADHTYQVEFIPTSAGPVNFKIKEFGSFNDNFGAITVRIDTKVAVAEFDVFASVPQGVNVSNCSPSLTTTCPLSPGKKYLAEAEGVYFWGVNGGQADAECANLQGPFVRDLLGPATQNGAGPDPLDLYVGGSNVEWRAKAATPEGCDQSNHTYTVAFTAPSTGTVNFRINDNNYSDNSGKIHVRIFEVPALVRAPVFELAEQLEVNTASSSGVSTVIPFQQGETVMIQASGMYSTGIGMADPECSTRDINPPDGVYRRDRVVPEAPGVTDLFDLLVGGTPVGWQAIEADAELCNSTNHSYVTSFVVGTAGSLNFRVKDAFHGDNIGILTVNILRSVSVSPPPPPSAVPEIPLPGGGGGEGGGTEVGNLHVQTLVVDSRNPSGTNSVSLAAGVAYLFTASGTFFYGLNGAQADPECSNLPPDPTYQRSRFTALGINEDLLDLYVNGGRTEWVSTNQDSLGCNRADHTYQVEFIPTSAGPVNFKIKELNSHSSHFGGITVRIDQKGPVAELDVWPSLPQGVDVPCSPSCPLSPGKKYLAEAEGVYFWGVNGAQADAECANLQGPFVRDLLGPGSQNNGAGPDPLDLYVGGSNVEWRAKAATPEGCDQSNHTYTVAFTAPSTGTVNFRINDSNYSDNSGRIHVRIFEVPAPTFVPFFELAEQLEVNTASSSGVSTVIPFQQGETVVIQASGMYSTGMGMADPECSTRDINPPDGVYRRDRVVPEAPGVTDLFDLLVGGTPVSWQAIEPDAELCNSTNHAYVTSFVVGAAGSLNFRVKDAFHGDNIGTISIKVSRVLLGGP